MEPIRENGNMKSRMKVSIVIPVYKVGSYIKRCVKSVLAQKYTGDMECILVDDCGNDQSIAIAERIIKASSKRIDVQVLHHEHNRGLSAARNTGLMAASGEYVYFLDSDDEIPENAIQLLVEEASKHPGLDMIQGFTQSVPMVEKYDTTCYQSHSFIDDNVWIRDNYYTNDRTIPVNGVNKLLRRNLLIENKIFFKEGILHEDEHWMYFLVKYIKSMAFVFEPTYIRYFNEGSIMSTLNEVKTGKSWSVILMDWVDNIDNISAKKQLKKILFRYTQRRVWKYSSSSNDRLFLNKLIKSLWKNAEIKSLMYLFIALLLRPFNKGTKCLRHAQESIKV